MQNIEYVYINKMRGRTTLMKNKHSILILTLAGVIVLLSACGSSSKVGESDITNSVLASKLDTPSENTKSTDSGDSAEKVSSGEKSYVLATDSDFVRETGGLLKDYWKYIGTETYVKVPSKIHGEIIRSTSYMFWNNEEIKGAIFSGPVEDMSYTFVNCVMLEGDAVVLPDGVVQLAFAFDNCLSLTKTPVIPKTVLSLQRTFDSCESLIEVGDIPEGVTNMKGTFRQCNSLVNAPKIPTTVLNMESTFAHCDKLLEAPMIPSNVISMAKTFEECKELRKFGTIPSSVKYLTSAFNFCESLSGEINMEANPEGYDSCFDFTGTKAKLSINYTKQNSNIVDKIIKDVLSKPEGEGPTVLIKGKLISK